MDEGDGELGKVANVVVQQLGGLVHAGVKAPVPDLAHVRMVRAGHKLLQVRKPKR